MEPRKRTMAKDPLENNDDNPKRAKFGNTIQALLRISSKGDSGMAVGAGGPSNTPVVLSTIENEPVGLDAGVPMSSTRQYIQSHTNPSINNANQSPRPAHLTDEDIPEPTNLNVPLADARPVNQVDPAGGSNFSRDPEVGATLNKGKGFKRFGSGVLGSVANAFGPVKQVADIFAECVDTYQAAGKFKAEYDQLIARLGGHLDDLAGYLGDGNSQPMTTSMERLCKSIKEELESIRDKKGKSKGTRARHLATDEDMDMILGCYRRVEGYLERLSLNANLSVWKIVHDHSTNYQSDRMFSLIDRLPSVLAARFKSAEGETLKRRECTPGTRVQEIAQVLGWARNGDDRAVYWLNGMAGTGKTTIAYSVCAGLEPAHLLGASFFCSRLREECRDAHRIIPSIAYQLARASRPFHHALCNALEKDPDVHGASLQMQFDVLIKNPTLQVQHTLPEVLIVVIDALDECDNKESTRRMLEVLLSESTHLPIKFILSSRPEPEIRDQMTERVKSRLVLHELDKGRVQGDIERYLREELAQMSPSEAQIAALVARSGMLFIYAATAVRYVGYDNFHSDPEDRLRTILSGSQSQDDGETEDIDQLYATVLETALENRRLRKVERDNMRQVLCTVICAREPLTVSGLSVLLEIGSADRVRAALRPLWSVLHVVGADELVTTLHASFPDFIFDATRSKAYHCDSDSFNRKLAGHCFSRIRVNQPQFNVCGLESSYFLDEVVSEVEGRDRFTKGIPLDLFYACRYWVDHAEAGGYALVAVSELQDFLSKRFLLWMEVMNLKGEMRAGMECMRLVVKWCNQLEQEHDLMDLAHDAQGFFDAFALNPISQGTPHIYVSMLTFWPRSGPIAKHYARYMDGPVSAEGTALGQRQLAFLVKWEFKEEIIEMRVSSDGLFVALLVYDGVMIVDFASGRVVLGPLQGSSRAGSLAFSPDGSRIISTSTPFSRSVELLGWDTRTGATVLGPLLLPHDSCRFGYPRGYMLSPDTTRTATLCGNNVYLWNVKNGDMLLSLETLDRGQTVILSSDSTRIAVGSYNSLRIWDAQTGNGILSLLDHCPAEMIAFSHDDSRIIHTSYFRKAIYVRDAHNGDLIHQLSSRYNHPIRCLGYSPNGRYIVSGTSKGTITVWNAQSGEVMLDGLEGHTSEVISVAFLPDSLIITGCMGGTVCTWNPRQHDPAYAPGPTATPSMLVTRVKFSPNGMKLVSGTADGTIYIWDSYTGEMVVGPIKAHTDRITALDFVDGRIVSGSYDGAMCVYDALSGQVLLGPLQVHQGCKGTIDAIAYLDDRNQIVTGSRRNPALGNSEVNLWNARTGERILSPLTDLDMEVRLIRLSPDRIRVSGTSAGYIKTVMWDVSNGIHTMNSYKSYSESATSSVCYSSDGALFASATVGEGIFLTDAYTGTKVLGPLVGHSDPVTSVSFSPDSTRLVSASYDNNTFRIWNIQTGEMMFELVHGHEGRIGSIAYSPDGTRISSLSDDMTARIHNSRSAEERALSRSTAEYADWVLSPNEWMVPAHLEQGFMWPGTETIVDHEEEELLRSTDEHADWTIDPDGWVVGDKSRLLVWVPADLRRALMRPTTQVMVAPWGYLRLKFDKSRIGESWEKGYTSRL